MATNPNPMHHAPERTTFHTPERLWLLSLSGFLANAAAHLARNAYRATKDGQMDAGDWLAYRILSAHSELVNVEGLFHA